MFANNRLNVKPWISTVQGFTTIPLHFPFQQKARSLNSGMIFCNNYKNDLAFF